MKSREFEDADDLDVDRAERTTMVFTSRVTSPTFSERLRHAPPTIIPNASVAQRPSGASSGAAQPGSSGSTPADDRQVALAVVERPEKLRRPDTRTCGVPAMRSQGAGRRSGSGPLATALRETLAKHLHVPVSTG